MKSIQMSALKQEGTTDASTLTIHRVVLVEKTNTVRVFVDGAQLPIDILVDTAVEVKKASAEEIESIVKVMFAG